MALVLLLGLAFGAHAESGVPVTGIRMADRELTTRFVLDVEHLGTYDVFMLENPPRLVVDIREGGWSVPASQLSRAKSRYVKNIRHGQPKPELLRIVLDLKEPVKTKKIFVVPPSSDRNLPRLVVDFLAASSHPVIAAPAPPPRTATPSDMPASMRYAAPGEGKRSQEVVLKEAPPEHAVSAPPAEMTAPPKASVPAKKPSLLAPFKHAKKPLVVIDPGHGGIDPGAMGQSNLREKEITFRYAVALKNALEKTGRYRAVLTRRGDYYVNLKKRVEVARESNGDIFISLHADSHPDPTTRGLSVYTLSENASDREAEALAHRANREEVLDGVDLKREPEDVKSLLIEMTQRDTKNASARFAEMLVKEVGKEARLLKNTHRFAGFVVLKGVDIPSVLVELGYLSNRHEERLLHTEAYKVKLVQSMVHALDRYFEQQ
jgi:N-acetylmuramoyl-L-alanine amidase